MHSKNKNKGYLMTKYILLAGIIFSFIVNAANADFADLIKKDSGIPVKEHPSLFFSAEDIPRLRQKAKSKYFKAHTADLLASADIMLKKYSGNRVFPFSENPNFQTITETLAMAYVITGKKKYSRRAIELVTTFANTHYEKIPVRDSGKFAGWMQRGNSTTFILIPISFVYDTLYDQMTEQERFDIRKGLAYFCQVTYNMICTAEYGMSFYKNYTAGETGALGIACMILKHETNWPVETWFERALRYTVSWLNVAVKADGMFPEGTSYFIYTAGNQMLFLNALSREQNIKYFDRTNLKSTLKWLNWGILPWKSEMDNFSDGSYNSSLRNIPFMFQQAYPGLGDYLVKQHFGAYPRYYSNPFAILFGNDPGNNFDPAKELGNSVLFKHAGMAAFRSGWSAQDVLMFIYATKYEYSAHSQADRGHFNLYGYGHKWLIDSGYGNDAKWINSGTPTQAHSLILIDGKGEGLDPSMRQSGTMADIDRYIADEKISYVRVDQKDAYDFFNRYTHVNRRIYNPVKKAFRNLIFVNKSETPPYALVYDDIDKDGKAHEYTYLLQLARGKKIATDGKQNLSLQPYAFSGNSISNIETGKYGDIKKPGYRIFRYLTGYIKLKINAPEAGKYIMWTFAKNNPGFSSNAEISINGKKYGRSQVGFSIDYDWFLITKNRKKMHKAYVFDIKQGENTIEFRGVTQGYSILKGLLVKYAPKAATKMPIAYKPENVTGISFDASNIVEKNDVQLVKVTQKASSECKIKALWPKNGKITIDQYQPTKDAAHKRMSFKVKSIEPNFLFMLYPKNVDMRSPKCNSQKIKNGIKTTIKWNNCQDIVLVNTGNSTIEDKESGIKTDAKLTFCRLTRNGKIIRILSSGCTLLENSGKKLYSGKVRTIIYENGKIKKEKYLINRTAKQRKVPKMINWKKAVLGTVAATAIVTSSNAAKLNTYSRLDINAEAGRIKLTPAKEKSSKRVAIFKATWRKDKKDFYLSSRAYFNKDIWRKIKVAFTPAKDGKAKLMFLGAWLPKPKQKNLVWFKYFNIKVDGKPISFDDKGWKLGKGTEFISSEGPDGKTVKCLKAKCYSTGDYTIDFKKDQTVIIEFDVKITK
jgi:Heparinase II/III-like protein